MRNGSYTYVFSIISLGKTFHFYAIYVDKTHEKFSSLKKWIRRITGGTRVEMMNDDEQHERRVSD